jgi:methylglutaconyl-CoA hydratase
MEYQFIETQTEAGIGRIVLNRPEKRNAFNDRLVLEIKHALQTLNEDPACSLVVFSGRGPSFSAGADLAYLQSLQNNSLQENLADSRALMELYYQMYGSPKVLIAQVEGPALAGGCGLATLCDYCFAVPSATFGYTEVRIGFIPALVSVFLVRKIGDARARELLLSGDILEAREALRYGLISFVVEADQIEETVSSFARNIAARCAPGSLAATRKLLAEVQDLPLTEALELAALRNAETRSSAECRKGIQAFLNKEPLNWHQNLPGSEG